MLRNLFRKISSQPSRKRQNTNGTKRIPISLNFPVGTIGAHVNKITSIYGRENNAVTGKPEWFINQIKAGNLVYMDKEKTLRWSTSARLQLPLEGAIKSLKKRIHTDTDIVKPVFAEKSPGVDAKGQPLYKKFNDAFKNWFGNSKVVDKNGKPLVVYRGEHCKITILMLFGGD